MKTRKRIAVFASGSGTNAEAIAIYLAEHEPHIEIAMVVTNRRGAGVHERMRRLSIPTVNFPKSQWLPVEEGGRGGAEVKRLMEEEHIDLIVLAGFLAIIPTELLEAFDGRIINIHPSLLPRHGGKGMYGDRVHEAVLAAGDTESGITIHRVTSEVDGGEILLQAKCPVNPDDTPHSLAARIHPLEHHHFPRLIARLLND